MMQDHNHQALMSQLGPATWAKLHGDMDAFAQQVGDSCGCGKMGQSVMVAFHDLVNHGLGKDLRDSSNLRQVAEWFKDAAGGEGNMEQSKSKVISLRKLTSWFQLSGDILLVADQISQSSPNGRQALQSIRQLNNELYDAMYRAEGHQQDASQSALVDAMLRRPAVPINKEAEQQKSGPSPFSAVPHVVVNTAAAIGTSAVLSKVLSAGAVVTSPEAAANIIHEPAGISSPKLMPNGSTPEGVDFVRVSDPGHIPGEPEIQLGSLMSEVAAVLNDKSKMGLIDPATQRVVREPR